MQACQTVPQRAAMRERTRPSDEISARRFAPAKELSAPDELLNEKLIELVLGLAEVLRAGTDMHACMHAYTVHASFEQVLTCTCTCMHASFEQVLTCMHTARMHPSSR